MLTRFPGVCACGCRAPFKAGSDVVRGGAGWVLSSCAARTAPPPSPSTGFAASMAEVREILARARVVRDRGGPAGQPAQAQGSRR